MRKITAKFFVFVSHCCCVMVVGCLFATAMSFGQSDFGKIAEGTAIWFVLAVLGQLAAILLKPDFETGETPVARGRRIGG